MCAWSSRKSNRCMKGERVILLHGLWMRAFTLLALRRGLGRSGYTVELFDYASVLRGPEVAVRRLVQRVRGSDNETVHLVGHSLGGLVALRALLREPDLINGRVVCLGTPLRGSAVARVLGGLPGGSWLLGTSESLLRDGLPRWQGLQQVGVIAGRMPVGFGFLFGSLASPHDGTVSVAETVIPGLSDHVQVAATHTGLLFSGTVVSQIVAFLRNGRFETRARGAAD